MEMMMMVGFVGFGFLFFGSIAYYYAVPYRGMEQFTQSAWVSALTVFYRQYKGKRDVILAEFEKNKSSPKLWSIVDALEKAPASLHTKAAEIIDRSEKKGQNRSNSISAMAA